MATEGPKSLRSPSEGHSQAIIPTLISGVRSSTRDSAATVHDVLDVSVSNTSDKVHARRDSGARTAHKVQMKRIDQQDETCTDTSLDDHRDKRIGQKLSKEIKITGFLPRSRLLAMLTQESIETELRKNDSFSERHPKLTRPLNFFSPERNSGRKRDFYSETLTILGNHPENQRASSNKSYVMIFAILILIERPTKIKRFIKGQVCDGDLPLLKRRFGEKFGLSRQSAPDESLDCFNKWSDTTIDKFERRQWTFLAPSFAAPEKISVPHLEVDSSEILPFKRCKEIRKGGFGDVHKVAIHRDHRAFGNKEDLWEVFAVKRLVRNQSREDFDREVATLRRFREDSYKHLISILATYKKDGSFHLIFPWAEADLFGFWKIGQTGRPPSERHDSSQTLSWLAQQCQGLAEGLGSIHRYSTTCGSSLLRSDRAVSSNATVAAGGAPDRGDSAKDLTLFGRHGDLKPNNILWFPCRTDSKSKINGILRIADFGFVEFSREEMAKKRVKALTVTYAPPERALKELIPISPLYDIWSLGCVYLEFIAWWVGGWNLVEEFAKRRKQEAGPVLPGMIGPEDRFYHVAENETTKQPATVKRSVLKFIEDSKKHSKADHFIQSFLVMIEQHMLVVLDKDGKGRLGASTIRRHIEDSYKGDQTFGDEEE